MILKNQKPENILVSENHETGCVYISDKNSGRLSNDICHKSLIDIECLESALDGRNICNIIM
jgi:hypothetical protein